MTDWTEIGAWILDDTDGRIRPLRDDDPSAAHEAAGRGKAMMLSRPVVLASGKLMGELLQVADDKAPVVIALSDGVDGMKLMYPVRPFPSEPGGMAGPY